MEFPINEKRKIMFEEVIKDLDKIIMPHIEMQSAAKDIIAATEIMDLLKAEMRFLLALGEAQKSMKTLHDKALSHMKGDDNG